MVVNRQEVKLDGDNGPFQFLKVGESNNFSRNASSDSHLHCGLFTSIWKREVAWKQMQGLLTLSPFFTGRTQEGVVCKQDWKLYSEACLKFVGAGGETPSLP